MQHTTPQMPFTTDPADLIASRTEVARLRDDNDDLRASASYWRRYTKRR
jgi:hypothetical protein